MRWGAVMRRLRWIRTQFDGLLLSEHLEVIRRCLVSDNIATSVYVPA